MKKFLLAAFLGLTIVFANVQAQAAVPEQDTWVLNWEGTDYYVVAGTLEYNEDYGIDVPLNFSCDVLRNGEIRHYDFEAIGNGGAKLFVDGELYGTSMHSKFIREIEMAISKLIVNR